SLLYLDAFNWSSPPTWFWWVAYIWFPLGALFILLNQRSEAAHPSSAPLARMVRLYLSAQGTVATLLGLLLLFVPTFMTTLWPWNISPLLAQVYGAPFMAYGVGSLFAARQESWSEVRIPVAAMLVFTTVAVLVSGLHSGVFNAANPSTWVWFLGLGGAALALAV